MVMSGHRPSNIHDNYLHFTDAMLLGHFKAAGLLLPPSERKHQTAAVG